jgi:hypothetical protein
VPPPAAPVLHRRHLLTPTPASWLHRLVSRARLRPSWPGTATPRLIGPPRRAALRSYPAHLAHLHVLFETYPDDASQTHRDRESVCLPSLCSLVTGWRAIHRGGRPARGRALASRCGPSASSTPYACVRSTIPRALRPRLREVSDDLLAVPRIYDRLPRARLRPRRAARLVAATRASAHGGTSTEPRTSASSPARSGALPRRERFDVGAEPEPGR